MLTRKPIPSHGLIITIALLSMVGPFSIDTYLPSFPAIEAEFQISRALLLQSMGFYLLASAISTLLWGPLSDRYGRKLIIKITLLMYMLSSLVCAIASDYDVFLLARVFQGIAASGGLVSGRAMIRDSHDGAEAHRAMSYVMMVFALAPAIAPVIGGWLGEMFGWRSVFYALAGYGGFLFILSLRFLHETLAIDARQSVHPVNVSLLYLKTLKHRRFRALVLTLGASFSGLFIFIAGAPNIIYDFLGLDSRQFAIQFIPLTLGVILGSLISARLSRHMSANSTVTLSLWVMLLATALNLVWSHAVPPSIANAVTPFALYAVGIAMLLPGLTILTMDCFPSNLGTASAIQGFVQGLSAAAVASLLVPALPVSLAGFAIGQAACIFTALLFWQRAS